MSQAYFWINIILLAVGTLIIRSSVIVASTRLKFSTQVKEIFSYIPAAVLPALAAPIVFYHQGVVEGLLGKERMVILILATVFAYLTKKMTLTLLIGMALLYYITQIY